jgi:hypothetical protein
MDARTVNTVEPATREEWRTPTVTTFELGELTRHDASPGNDGDGIFTFS